MGHIKFLNQDGEWEVFPNEELEAHLRANAELLEEIGYILICQMCNKLPTYAQIRRRYMLNEWTCDSCHAVNSAGRA